MSYAILRSLIPRNKAILAMTGDASVESLPEDGLKHNTDVTQSVGINDTPIHHELYRIQDHKDP